MLCSVQIHVGSQGFEHDRFLLAPQDKIYLGSEDLNRSGSRSASPGPQAYRSESLLTKHTVRRLAPADMHLLTLAASRTHHLVGSSKAAPAQESS